MHFISTLGLTEFFYFFLFSSGFCWVFNSNGGGCPQENVGSTVLKDGLAWLSSKGCPFWPGPVRCSQTEPVRNVANLELNLKQCPFFTILILQNVWFKSKTNKQR